MKNWFKRKEKNESMVLDGGRIFGSLDSDGALYKHVDGLSLQNLFFAKNHYFPNCYMFTKPDQSGYTYFDCPALLNHLRETAKPEDCMMTVVYTVGNIETKEEEIGFSIIYPKKNIYARFENRISESYILYGHNDGEALRWLIGEVKKFYKEEKTEENNIFLISQSQAGFGLNKWDINEVPDFDIDKQYNDDFAHADEVITDFMNNEKKAGLLILHGEKGTGKSTYIRHLVTTFREKRFVFVHSGLITLLGEPAFNNFLLSLSNHVIILEDCEDALKARNAAGSTAAVGVLLNMTDGLLADGLHIKFICTFNEDISSIDDALLRKGRLVCKYEFKKLSVEKTNALLAEIYSGKTKVDENGEEVPVEAPTTTVPMSLADIYNYYEDSYERKKSKFI